MGERSVWFWVNDDSAPSFRHRLETVRGELERRGLRCSTEAFPRGRYGLRVLERLGRLRATDLLVVAKLKLLPGESGLVRRATRRIVYDFDDAVYLGKPPALGAPPDESAWRMAKFRATCRMADLVVAGNDTLGAMARRFARRVEVVPTPIDSRRYPASPPMRDGLRLVWIGLPENLPYLELIRPALVVLARELPGLKVRIISSRFPDWPDVPIETVRWSEATEGAEIAAADVGLMPLTDDGWARGKCSFKLLQYMAAGLPSVASPVGANTTVAVEGVTTLFARDDREWRDAMRALLASPERRREMGEAARRRAQEHFDVDRIASRTADLFEALLARQAKSRDVAL